MVLLLLVVCFYIIVPYFVSKVIVKLLSERKLND